MPDLDRAGRPHRARQAVAPLFGQATFVGVGLINGSLARDVRRLGLVERLVGTARRKDMLNRACELGLVDEATVDMEAAVRNADLVVIGVPVGASGAVACAVAPALRADAVVTDVGSAKAQVIELVAPHLDMRRFVPAHPVAGREKFGPDAAVDHLFDGRWCILTPTPGVTDGRVIEQVAALWRGVGCRIDVMDALHHDKVLAVISHLPHLLAFSMVATADHIEQLLDGEVLKYAAGGFTDFIRIAGADPTMWRDIILQNKAAVLEVLDHYVGDLAMLRDAICRDASDHLLDRFESARAIRQELVQAGQEYRRYAPAESKPAAFASGVSVQE